MAWSTDTEKLSSFIQHQFARATNLTEHGTSRASISTGVRATQGALLDLTIQKAD
jgi:hypothetical protein